MFNKYLQIVTEGNNHVYNEGSYELEDIPHVIKMNLKNKQLTESHLMELDMSLKSYVDSKTRVNKKTLDVIEDLINSIERNRVPVTNESKDYIKNIKESINKLN